MKNPATTVFTNCRIFTSDDERPYADIMAVRKGRIYWIGTEEEWKNSRKEAVCGARETAEYINLNGKRVLPGFVDGHMHVAMLAEMNRQISALPPEINSIAELTGAIELVRRRQGPDCWIEGWGYDEGKLAEKRPPNRYDLDKGADDVPVSITRTCQHIRCVNSMALKLAGIDKNTPDPPGGKIERDLKTGEPTGILRENARDLITKLIPVKTHEERINDITEFGKLLTSQGITSVADMGDLRGENSYDVLTAAAQKGFRQKTAVYFLWEYFANEKRLPVIDNAFSYDNQIRAAGLKLIGDGSISGRTAWTDKAYLGNSEEFGMPVCSDRLLESAINFCKNHGCQLSMHAMGSRAIDRIISRVKDEDKWTTGAVPHVRVEHVTEPGIEAVKTAAEKGIAFATQPIFLYAEVESYLKNLGQERMKKTYPVKDILKMGVKLCFSTDAPATSWAVPSDPFSCIKGAVTRIACDGTDCGSSQKVDIETALKLYTKESAEISGFKDTGILKPGYFADFIVLDRDILNIPADDIDKVMVEQTYIEGERQTP